MAHYLRKHWTPTFREGLSRRDRQGCEYETYVPDGLQGRHFTITGSTAADIADAETAIARFNREAMTLTNSEGIARLLLRTEAVASSRIEGLAASARRILRAEAGLSDEPGPLHRDITAEEILANIRAMARAIDLASSDGPVEIAHMIEIHTLLLEGTPAAAYAGVLRTEQNWIGGSNYNPCSAAFVPPPPELVADLLDDLCAFASGDTLSPLAQAAIAHAQFETIHPFADGNGRTGRALIHIILRRRGLAPRFVPPISLALAAASRDYIGGLEAARYDGPPESTPAQEGLDLWLSTFAGAALRSVAVADRFEETIQSLRAGWESRLGKVRAGSALARLLDALPGTPVLSVGTAATLIGRSFQAANGAFEELVAAGILRRVGDRRRGRVFEATQVIEAFADLDSELA